MNIITVEDMYNKSVESGSKLFPLLNLDFWNNYSENSEIFDRRFCNLYSSFFYYAQKEDDSIESVLQKFKNYVGDFLYFNSKKYSELYRINNISDAAYSITDNYSTTETLERENTNSSNETIGEKANTETTLYGSRQNNSSTSYGSRQDNSSTSYGSRHDDTSTTIGSQTNTTTDKVSTYDSESFYNKTNTEDSLSERTDSVSSNMGEHTDTTTSNSGEHTDTTTSNSGEQTNIKNDTSTERYTLTKKGNIGVKTVSEILNEHNNFWDSFSFYDRIFKDICSECLLV